MIMELLLLKVALEFHTNKTKLKDTSHLDLGQNSFHLFARDNHSTCTQDQHGAVHICFYF